MVHRVEVTPEAGDITYWATKAARLEVRVKNLEDNAKQLLYQLSTDGDVQSAAAALHKTLVER